MTKTLPPVESLSKYLGEVVLEVTPEMKEHIKNVSKNMEGTDRARDRTLDELIEDNYNTLLEIALCQHVPELLWNEAYWDIYGWDCHDPELGVNIDVKKQGENYYNIYSDFLKSVIANRHQIDVFVTGTIKKIDETKALCTFRNAFFRKAIIKDDFDEYLPEPPVGEMPHWAGPKYRVSYFKETSEKYKTTYGFYDHRKPNDLGVHYYKKKGMTYADRQNRSSS